jgi:hypothetical protein
MPTPNQIMETFNIWYFDALLASTMLANVFRANEYLTKNKLAYNRLPASEVKLMALNHLLPDCYGVEALWIGEDERMAADHPWSDGVPDRQGSVVALYLNRGEAYASTIIWDIARGEFIIASWGDWYEHNVILN